MTADVGSSPFFWIDLEMTGLDPDRDRILECACLITDGELQEIAAGPELVIHQSRELLDGMDEWNKEHHGTSGLVQRVLDSTMDEGAAEEQLLEFLPRHAEPGCALLAGNSVHQDRRFLVRYMPRLDAYLHYRIVDVSTVKELVRRWYPTVYDSAPAKSGAHRALTDIRESIAELRHYRENAFRARGAGD